ncbi:MAG: VUT family protein [Deltaproteobacteria bacterium]|nr:MAG: VUT family protein [Deltaproteobacteria bacterium]
MRDAGPLPTEQHRYEDLPELALAEVHFRRERVFLVFAGLFLGTLTMLNILGITHFIDLSFDFMGVHVPVPLAVGVLPYPVTFLCTDFISEIYGRRRANEVVLMGLVLNAWVVFIVWLGGVLPTAIPPGESVFMRVRELTFGAVTASMVAYLVAQLVDVQLFHFWKRLTNGRHLWLRNNGSTLVSQLVDTVAVILITHHLGALPIAAGEPVGPQLAAYIGAGYVFKMATALIDTLPFYVGVHHLSRYLRLAPAGLVDGSLAPE